MATSVDSSKTGEGGGGLPAASSADVQEATSDQVAVTPLSLAESDVYAEKTYVDELVVGVLRDRGNYDASGNTFPASGGSGAAGAIKKGDLWYISVAGTLGSAAVAVGDTVRALADTPGQTAGNWAVMENNLGYVPERSIDAASAKTTPVDADTMGIIDSAASNVLKKITWANIKAALKTYFDTLYGTGITEGTVYTLSSQASRSWSIPATAKRITLRVVAMSGANGGTAPIQFRLNGETSGYLGAVAQSNNTSANLSYAAQTGFCVDTAAGAGGQVYYGEVTISRMDASTNTWTMSGNISNPAFVMSMSGSKALSGAISQLTLIAPGTTFDGGSASASWE
jgi:hypothetical protein